MVSPILNSESTNSLTNICYDLFINLQTEKKKLQDFLLQMAKTEVNLLTRIVKQIGENIWWIHYLFQVSHEMEI